MSYYHRIVIYIFIVHLTQIFHAQLPCLFGEDSACKFECHCGNYTHPERCDANTGSCSSGSCGISGSTTWSGPGCQAGNIAHGKDAYVVDWYNHSKVLYNYHELLHHTIPKQDSCADFVNVGSRRVTWMIDLLKPMEIKEINMRMNVSEITKYFDEFNLYYCYIVIEGNNITNTATIRMCDYYRLRKYDAYGIINISCQSKVSRYVFVRIYTCRFEEYKFIHLPLCELTILGQPCTSIECKNCLQNDTEPCGNGIWCEYCSPGFKLPDCKTQCEYGYYGVNCMEECPHHCKHINCDTITGYVEQRNCVECDLWYIGPQQLCVDYIHLLDPKHQLISEVHMTREKTEIIFLNDQRIKPGLHIYYKYIFEHVRYKKSHMYSSVFDENGYLQNNGTTHTTVVVDESIFTYGYLRLRLYREHQGSKETSFPPSSVYIPEGCVVNSSVDVNSCIVNVSWYPSACKQADGIAIMYRQTEPDADTTWTVMDISAEKHDFKSVYISTTGFYELKVKTFSIDKSCSLSWYSDIVHFKVREHCDQRLESSNNFNTTSYIFIVLFALALLIIIILISFFNWSKILQWWQQFVDKRKNGSKEKEGKINSEQKTTQAYENVAYDTEHDQDKTLYINAQCQGNAMVKKKASEQIKPKLKKKHDVSSIQAPQRNNSEMAYEETEIGTNNDESLNQIMVSVHDIAGKKGKTNYEELDINTIQVETPNLYEEMIKK